MSGSSGSSAKASATVTWDCLDLTKAAIYGPVGSFFIDGTLHPLELVKTRLQVQGQPHVLASHDPYLSFRHACGQIWRHEGARGESCAPRLRVLTHRR